MADVKIYRYSVLYLESYSDGYRRIVPIPFDDSIACVPMEYNFSLGVLSLTVKNFTSIGNESARRHVDAWVRKGAYVRDENQNVMHLWECEFNEIVVI